MGISGLSAFLHDYFQRCWSFVNVDDPQSNAAQYDYLYIDANCLLYGNNRGDVRGFLRRLQAEIDRLLNFNGVPKAVFLALDGPGAIGALHATLLLSACAASSSRKDL